VHLRKACPYCPRSAVCLGSNALQVEFTLEAHAAEDSFVVKCTTLDPTHTVWGWRATEAHGRAFHHYESQPRKITVKFAVPNAVEIREEFQNDKI
jgi:hypothetical protein